MGTSSTPMKTAVGRGLRKRCPQCGQGRLFTGWSQHTDQCVVCGLVYERNRGDTWAFTILLDRLPLGLLIALVYLGLFRVNRVVWPVLSIPVGMRDNPWNGRSRT